jgi:hypothetical protein
MKCTNCTTELWGRPAVCPVCGTPTGLNRRSSRQTPPPWAGTPQAEPRAQAQGQPFFNASDLLDPEALDAVPQAPASARKFSSGPLHEDRSAPEPQQGMFNAADLFDPNILADLNAPSEEGRSFQNYPKAPEEEDYQQFDEEDPQAYQDDEDDYRQPPPRQSTGPIAPPFFKLAALPATGPQPTMMPPPPPPPIFPPRESAPAAPMAPPEERTQRPQRGYNIVSGPPPLGSPPNRQAMVPSGLVPAGPYAMPTPPPSKVDARPRRRGRPFLGTLGGFMSLLLVLAIIGGALLFGATRLFQLQALEPKPAQTTIASLPTVAPKPGYTIYPDHTLSISLQFANNWQQLSDQDKSDAGYHGDLFFAGTNPGFDTGFEIGSSPQYSSWSPSQIDDYILSNPFPLPNITAIQTFVPTSPTIHITNQDWTAEDANITLANGVNLRITCLAIIHNGRGYAIFYFAHQEVFSTDYAQYFEPMLLSFRFLNN